MELRRALDQISEIHTQLAKTETFRGYRALPTALGGVLGLLAATLQDRWLAVAPEGLVAGAGGSYAEYWLMVATLAGVVGLVPLGVKVYRSSAREQRRSLEAIAQIVPALGLGAVAGLVLAERPGLLPGLWCGVWALGLWASRPYLPRAVGWVCAYYLVLSCALLAQLDAVTTPSAWSMGATFGCGQLLLALVLWLQLERGASSILDSPSRRECGS